MASVLIKAGPMNFVSGGPIDVPHLRTLNFVDHFSEECLPIDVDGSLPRCGLWQYWSDWLQANFKVPAKPGNSKRSKLTIYSFGMVVSTKAQNPHLVSGN
jgi:hypothetical protein